MKKLYLGLIISAATLSLMGCRKHQPVYQVDHHELPYSAENLSDSQMRRSILKVASRRGWDCAERGHNRLVCRRERRGHSAEIEIKYTHNDFSIRRLRNSSELDGEDGQIHRNYNKWVKILERDIMREFRNKY